MKNQFRIWALLSALALPALAAPSSVLCENGQCQPAITQTRYFDRDAYRLSDGKTEAIVVPALGRIMRYGKVGRPNLLWNSPTSAGYNWGWMNYGGDKNWLAPQTWWGIWHAKGNWPPDPDFDGKPHNAQVLSGGKLRMTSNLSPSTGIRMERTIFFDAAGDLVIQQTARKERGAKVRAGIWSIAQVPFSDAVYVPLNEKSPYKNNFYYFGENRSHPVETVKPSLLRVLPNQNGKAGWKIGADSPVSAIATVQNGVAFLLKTPLPKGNYPDGADGAGFPIELYINGSDDPNARYMELELLGPLNDYAVGTSFTHTMRWSLHDMPLLDAKSGEVADAVEKLLLK